MRATVLAVDAPKAGTYLVAPVEAESVTLVVYDATTLSAPGARALIGDDDIEILSIEWGQGEDAPDTVTLAWPTTAEVEEGQPVRAIPEVTVTWAEVLIDGEDDTKNVRVGQAHQSKVALTEGPKTEPYPTVELERLPGGETVITDVIGRGADDATQLTGPLPQSVIDESNLPGADLTELYEQLDALAAELAEVLPITESKIADNAITTPKLVANAVTTLKLAAEAVTAEKLFVDTAMVTKLVAKMIEVEALNAQVVTGLQIIGGSISIAQGVASTLDQSFETASGTTPPSGWTRTVVANTGTVTGGGVDFPTTGGNPGRRLRLRTAQVASGVGNVSHQVVSPTAVTAADSTTEFDYRWAGDELGVSFGTEVGLALRSATPGDRSSQVVRVQLQDGRVTVYSGGSTASLGSQMAIDTYHRVKVTVRGNTLRIDRTPDGGSPLPTIATTISSSSRSGSIEFYAYTSGFTGALTAAQEISVDDVHIETLQTGLLVAPDGKTTAEYFQVNQAAVVPDPILPVNPTTSMAAINYRTMAAAIAAASPSAIYACRSRTGSNQAIPASTWTSVNFDTALATDGIPWTSGSVGFTVPEAGKYLVNANVRWAGNTSGQRIAGIAVNGTRERSTNTLPQGSSGYSVAISQMLMLAAGDVVAIQVWQSSGGNLNVETTTGYTWVDITRVGA